jgi:sarcosine oxidase subunit alpha
LPSKPGILPTDMPRLAPFRRKVELLHDGDLLPAEWGEPLAISLIAEGRLVLSRSPKLHRPRAPYCLRAACDGCLVRVDGVPNVMACRHAVKGGESVETQNVLGSRELDLLAATDFFFPHGIDHHRLLAGVTGISRVVQGMARRIAGLGRLPDEAYTAEPAEHGQSELLIVGGGAAGLAVAAAVGPRARLVEEERELGGALRWLEPARAAKLADAARNAGAQLETETTALGVYAEPSASGAAVLLATPRGLSFLRAHRIVLATGGHERLPPFPGNDLPGIFSARAGLALLAGGVLPGQRVAVVGQGEYAQRARDEFSRWLVAHVAELESVRGVEGRARAHELVVDAAGSERRFEIDTLLFAADETPAFELAVQAGASTRWESARGYVPVLNAQHEAAPGVYCVGWASDGASDAVGSGSALGAVLREQLDRA